MEHQTNSRPIAMKELARSAISWVLEPGIGHRGISQVAKGLRRCPVIDSALYDKAYPLGTVVSWIDW